MRINRLVLSAAVGMLVALGAAQATDTGTVVIKTLEKSGSPLPGVVVEIFNSKGASVPKAKQTDGTGTASFNLSAGSGYSVKVSMGSFSAQTSEEFKLELSKTKTILFTMQEQIVEKVQVKAKVVDLDEGGENKVSFTDTFVEDLPILGRNYQNVLTLAPGINDSDGDGNPNVHGSRERDFKATVDGVSNVDPLTGTFMSNINPDAIEEIEIVTTGASAEYGGAVGGFGKIITKQGTNAFDGNTSIYLRSSFFDGSTINSGTDAQEEAHYHDVRPTLNFTGPVVKDKVFFAMFHEYIDQGLPINLLGGGSVVRVTKGSRNLDKLTWQVSPRNKLIFQAQSDPFRRGPLGIDSLTDPQSGVDYKQGGPVYQFHWNAQVSSVLNVETLVGMSHTGISLIPTTNGIRNSCGVDEEGAIGGRHDPRGNTGGLRIDEDYCFETKTSRRTGSYLEKYSDDRIRYTLKSDASYFLDNFLGVSHTLKAGFVAEKKRFSSNDQIRPFSTFTEATAHFGGVDSPSTTGGGVLNRLVYVPGLPETAPNSGEGASYAVYLEDQFRPHPNVSVRVGMRVEQENMKAEGFKHFDPGAESSQFQKSYDICIAQGTNPTTCSTSNFHFFHTYDFFPVFGNSPIRVLIDDPRLGIQQRTPESFRISNTNVGPRLNLSWDPGTNGKMKLFGTAGRYYGETFLAVPLFEQPPDTFLYTYTVEPVQSCIPEGDSTVCRTRSVIQGDSEPGSTVAPASIRQVDRHLRTPYDDEYTLGFSREIFQETSITVTYIKRNYKDQFQDVDTNHFAKDQGNTFAGGCIRQRNGALVPIDRNPDGIFDDCGGRIDTVPGPPPFNQPQIIEVPDGIPDLYINNPFFNQVQLVGNFNKSEYTAYEIEIKRRLHRNWELEGSYVWSKAVGNAEDYSLALGNDPTTIQDEFGYLSFDQRHLVKVNLRTQLPLWNVRLSSAFTWQSGLPYSVTEARISRDQARSFGTFDIAYSSTRTTFPSHQRNDQRNEDYWLFDCGARKDFTLGKTNVEASLDVFNLFNEDALRIEAIRNERVVAQRRTGRQFQVGAKVTF